MKVKQSPQDFQVEELTHVPLVPGAEQGFYRLTKSNWTTHDALDWLHERWRVPKHAISYGGLKDRHASTIQYISIFRGPRASVERDGIMVEYLGQIADAYSSRDMAGNRFRLTVRDMSEAEVQAAIAALTEVATVGIPNYFDDQRFGSLGDDDEFIARLLVREQFEAALKLALAGRYEHDPAAVKRDKHLIRQHWNDWPTLKSALRRGPSRSIVDYLVTHPDDYKGAFARLRHDMQTLYLSAYQSHLWNRLLAEWLHLHHAPEQLSSVELRMGLHPLPRKLDDAALATWRELELPYPSARLTWDEQAEWAPALRRVLDAEGLELADIRLRGPRQPFFSKGLRVAAVIPQGTMHQDEPDEKHHGRRKLCLGFDLPPGAYATMFIKRITSLEPTH